MTQTETSLKSQKETQQPNQKPKIITPNKELIGVKKSELKKPKGVSESYNGSYVFGKLGGVKVGNESLKKYYSKLINGSGKSSI